jgi:hypothetical protein
MLTGRTKANAGLGVFPHFSCGTEFLAVVLPPNQSWILLLPMDKRQEFSQEISLAHLPKGEQGFTKL